MKLIIILLLCGIRWSAAEDSCIIKDLKKCRMNLSEDELETIYFTGETTETLNAYCKVNAKVLDCEMKFCERCSELSQDVCNAIKDFQSFLTKLCNEDHPFRKNYLDNVSCYKRIVNEEEIRCNYTSEDICEKSRQSDECIEAILSEECGESVKDIQSELSKLNTPPACRS